MTLVSPEPTTVHSGEIDASPPASVDTERLRIGIARGLTALSLVLAWFLVYAFVLSSFQQNHAQSSLYGVLRTQLAEGTAPTGAPIAPGAPVALLEIPAAGLEPVVVVEGTSSAQLQAGPGHFGGSVLPGQHGVSVVAGRSVSFGAPFRKLTRLPLGSSVIVSTAQGRFVYAISGIRRDGDPMPTAPSDGAGRLTLVTASRSGILDISPGETVYVDAVLEQGAAPAGSRSPSEADPKFLAPHASAGDLAQLALALQLLIAVLAATVWAWQRWSRLGAWIAGGPAVLAALWLVSSLGSRLLPGLI